MPLATELTRRLGIRGSLHLFDVYPRSSLQQGEKRNRVNE
jgi:hypothetical protein